jgi:predicted nucleic acid-binding protein
MRTWLLDSGIIIDVLNGKRGRGEFIDKSLRGGAVMACCSINVTEVYAGLRAGEEARTERFLRSLKFFEVTWEIARLAGDQQNYWRRQGRTLALPDMTIAAVAVAHRLVLVTANAKAFPMPELELYPLP